MKIEEFKRYSGVLVEAEKNSIGLTEAEHKRGEINKKYLATAAEMDRLWAEATKKADEYNKTSGVVTKTTDWLTQEYYEQDAALKQLDDDLRIAGETVKNYEKAIKEGGDAAALAKEEIERAEKAVMNLSGATEDGRLAAAEAVRQQEEAVRLQIEMQSVIDSTTERMIELSEAYAEAHDAALSSVLEQYELWDKAAKVVEISAETINSGLESQIKYWQEYNASVAGLSDRAGDIEGLSEMISSFADGSKDSVNAIAGMASATDGELAAMVKNWQSLKKEQETIANSLAELETGYSESMAALQSELESTIQEMNLGAEASDSARNTIQGFIDGAEEMLPEVERAYKRIADAAKYALEINATFAYARSTYDWRSVQEFQANAQRVNGSHALGLDYVPFDGYIAELHKGERVLTAEEAEYVALAPRLMTAQYAMGAGTSAAVVEPYGISNGAINISLGGMTFNIDAEVAANSDSLREALFHASDEFGDFIINKIEDYYYDKARRAYK